MADDFKSDNVTLISPAYTGEAVDISSTDHAFSSITRAIYIGTGGSVVVTTAFGDTLTFTNVQDGSVLPLRLSSVVRTGTTASGMIGLW